MAFEGTWEERLHVGTPAWTLRAGLPLASRCICILAICLPPLVSSCGGSRWLALPCPSPGRGAPASAGGPPAPCSFFPEQTAAPGLPPTVCPVSAQAHLRRSVRPLPS